MAANMELIESIHRTEQDIEASAKRIKSLKADRKDEVERLDEYETVQNLATELQAARLLLKAAMKEDRSVAPINAEIEAEQLKQADLREILSHHLIEYREATRASEVPEAEGNKVRAIKLHATLGKPEFHQESMFDEAAPERRYEISSSDSDKKVVIDGAGIRTEKKVEDISKWPAKNSRQRKAVVEHGVNGGKE